MTIKHKQFNRNILIKSINFEMGCLAGKHIFVNSKNTKIGISQMIFNQPVIYLICLHSLTKLSGQIGNFSAQIQLLKI